MKEDGTHRLSINVICMFQTALLHANEVSSSTIQMWFHPRAPGQTSQEVRHNVHAMHQIYKSMEKALYY